MMKSNTLHLTVFLVTILFQRSYCLTDPCLSAISIGDTRRTTTEDPGTCGGICDNYIQAGQWYRLDVSNSGARMPESCVPIWHCGTYIPIWLNGAHPTDSTPVTRQVCAQLSNTGPCCEWNDVVTVKQCMDGNVVYYVYQLRPTPFCNMAYCAGTGINCGASASWNDITNNCTSPPYPSLSVAPVLIGPYISKTQQVTDNTGKAFTASMFSLKCQLSYTQRSVDDGGRYDVVFQSGNQVIYTQTLSSTDLPEAVMSETYLIGQLNNNIICRVSSYWKSQFPLRSPFSNSNPYYFGIYVLNAKTTAQLPFTGTPLTEGTTISITVKPTFPVTTPGCFSSGTGCFPYYTLRFYTGDLYSSLCTILVYSNSSVTVNVMTPIVNSGNPGTFTILADNTPQTQTSVFNGYNSNQYQISINRRYWNSCTSWGDPHIITFNGPSYNIYLDGYFTLVSVPARKIEVQVRQIPCGATVTCNCGVIAREGNNIIGIDYCSKAWPVFTRYQKDANYPGGYITDTASGKTIVLPSGMQITVTRFSGGSIDITLSWFNDESYQGLCTFIPNQEPCTTNCNAYRVSSPNFFTISASSCLDPVPLVPQCDCASGGVGFGDCPWQRGDTIIELPRACSVTNQSKRKRQATTPPGASGDGSYDPNFGMTPPNLVWPTPKNHIDQSTANTACQNALQASTAYQLCVNTLRVDVSSIIQFCVLDIQILDDLITPPKFVAAQMESICKFMIDNSSDATRDSWNQQYSNAVCPNQCSSRGNCTNGVCRCNSGYIGNDCSLMKGQIPSISGVQSATCNTRKDAYNCSFVFIYAVNVSSGATCRISNAGGAVLSYDSNPSVSSGFVVCQLPELQLIYILNQESTKCNYTINIALSNDGNAYSNQVTFVVYDDQSLSCNKRSSATRNIAAAALLLLVYIFGIMLRSTV